MTDPTERQTVTESTDTLIKNRNTASGSLRTLIHHGTSDIATYTDGARRALATAASSHKSLCGEEPSDPEYVAAMALLSAAEGFVSAARAAQAVISAPNNWRPAGSAIDNALKAASA